MSTPTCLLANTTTLKKGGAGTAVVAQSTLAYYSILHHSLSSLLLSSPNETQSEHWSSELFSPKPSAIFQSAASQLIKQPGQL